MGSPENRRFDELYAQQFRDVLAFCMRRGPADDAYDVANEIFAIAWRRLADVPDGEAAQPWLSVVAKRVLYRRRRVARRFNRLADKMRSVRQVSEPDPETVVGQRAEYDAVLRAAARLSQRDREIPRLAAWEGLPHREIAQILDCSIAAVDQRLHRAKQRLARQYHAQGVDAVLPFVAGGEEP